MNGSISTYLMCAVYNWAPKFRFSVFESTLKGATTMAR
jgi:hypothetical protein